MSVYVFVNGLTDRVPACLLSTPSSAVDSVASPVSPGSSDIGAREEEKAGVKVGA